MEFLKDYDIFILYHPSKDNVVADALIQKPMRMGSSAWLEVLGHSLSREVQILANSLMRLQMTTRENVQSIDAKSTFLEKIGETQFENKKQNKIWKKVLHSESKKDILDKEEVLRIQGCVGVPVWET